MPTALFGCAASNICGMAKALHEDEGSRMGFKRPQRRKIIVVSFYRCKVV
jgi:hypothetical protein